MAKIENDIRAEKKKKVPALPIPEGDYARFKYRLEEVSKDCPERNMIAFYVGVGTGYRLGDYIGLTVGDIKEFLQEDKFVIQESKQYKAWQKHISKYPNSRRKPPVAREAMIQPKLRKLLKDFVRGKKNSEYAFASTKYKDKPITPKSYSDILKSVGEELGLKHITGHSLRKTYAQRLWQERRDLEFVRKSLGHKSIETTKFYLGLDNEIKEDASRIADSKL